MTDEISRLPSLHSGVVAAATVSVVTLALGFYAAIAVPFGVLALCAAAVAVVRGWRRAAVWAGILLFGGVVAAAVENAPTPVVLVGAGGAVVVWDLLDNAIGLGEQLGREADTRRTEVVHAAGSVALAFAVSAGSYGLYSLAGGEKPLSALVFLLVAVVALTSVLRT